MPEKKQGEDMLNEFIEWAGKNDWNISVVQNRTDIPDIIRERYAVPEQWADFIRGAHICENSTATKWFLTFEDYSTVSDGFQWNEFELQSLDVCDNDEEKESIISFWDIHLPIILSVENGYSYYAVNTENGCVVSGHEPEFEECTVIADSFSAFIEKIISGEIVL